MSTTITRDDLARLVGISPKLLRALDELFTTVPNISDSVDGQIAQTGAIQNATVVTLSSNAAFNNERILTAGNGVNFTVTSDSVIIDAASDIKNNGNYALTFNTKADSNLNLPTSGTLATLDLGPIYADDVAAAAGGVAIGEMYKRTDGVVSWRVA